MNRHALHTKAISDIKHVRRSNEAQLNRQVKEYEQKYKIRVLGNKRKELKKIFREGM